MRALARRTEQIAPFYVMEIAKAAARLQAAGRSVIHLSIGEPDFTAPADVVEAARSVLSEGSTQYTPALGTDALREAVAGWYRSAHGLAIGPERIAITAGASAALQLACAVLIDEGDEVLMPDPCYPCNRHFVAAFGGCAVLLPCGPESRFQLDAAQVVAAWGERTAGVLLASPSNPTGTSIPQRTLAEVLAATRARGGFAIVDEIYQGLSYDARPASAATLDPDAIVVNSFSKTFGMTGWRLGWLVLPEPLVAPLERLAQNLFICPSAIAQHAALGCFTAASLAECEQRRLAYRARRDRLVPALEALGLRVPARPDGAFYVYADVSAHARDSWDFAFDLLDATGVCVVPGRDFSLAEPERYVRISYATGQARIDEAVERMRVWLGG